MRLSLNLRRAISKVRYRGQKYGNEALIKPAEGYLEGGIASAKLLLDLISRECPNAQDVKVTPCHTANVASSYQKNKTRHTALMRDNEDCRMLELIQHHGIYSRKEIAVEVDIKGMRQCPGCENNSLPHRKCVRFVSEEQDTAHCMNEGQRRFERAEIIPILWD
ncbi:hypothetical protein CDAR_15881 [Caerostris darwini]|uniref:Uncharacterized protein n=1 Tax=Caerostris darwini TaxID=1538125 RepID=A0AAV4N9K3_9ARAC|nr:hypothetical protein CDAR_15881 [Caerostris darwini]